MFGVPATHAPAEHASPVVHAVQALPPVPQLPGACTLYGTQVLLALQQPIAQLLELQLPPLVQTPVVVEQVKPVLHPAHAAPPVPHEVLVWLA